MSDIDLPSGFMIAAIKASKEGAARHEFFAELQKLFMRSPVRAQEALTFSKNVLSEASSRYQVVATELLSVIATGQPDLASQALYLAHIAFRSTDQWVRIASYESMGAIALRQAHLFDASSVSQIASRAIIEHHSDGIEAAQKTLAVLLDHRPEFAPAILGLAKAATTNQDWRTRQGGYRVIGIIVDKQPRLAEDALATVKPVTMAQNAEAETVAAEARNTHDVILRRRPELGLPSMQHFAPVPA